MKIIKKIAAIMLSVMMVLGMCSVVGAEGATTSGTGTLGSITINKAAPGETYKIYRILDLESYNETTGNYAYKLRTYEPSSTYNWNTFIKSNNIKDTYVTLDGEYVTWKNGASAEQFAKAALAYAKSSTEIAADDTKNAPNAASGETTSTVTFTGLPLGYYLVETSVGTVLALNTTNSTWTIEDKNKAPTVEKKVKSGESYEDNSTASIGDTIKFQTTITAQPGAQNYVLHDKMDAGLTFNDIESVKVGETELSTTTDYAVEKSTGDGCTFHITFTPTYCESITATTTIIVTYSAILNENAEVGTTKENKNETWLKYGENKNLETIHSKTTTKTYEIPVFKFTKLKDASETKKGLANAEFTLSTNVNGTSPINLVAITPTTSTTDKTYRVEMGTASTGTTTTTTVITPESGKFTIKGLAAGTYYLTETKQPDGYNKLTSPVKIDITKDGKITVGTETITSENPVKVENKTGSLLPSTGGMGTTLFYIFGAILVVGSGVVLITKKRMK